MEFQFSNKMKNIKSSEIRELLKYIHMPGMISFGGGLPNPESFPGEELRNILDDIMENYVSSALQYGQTNGLPELKEQLAAYLKSDENINVDPENILLTTGSQQALYALPLIFANEGDYVITEAPTYVGMLSSLTASGIRSQSVSMDDNGRAGREN